MTVKDFVEAVGGIDEFEVFGKDFFEFYKKYQKEQLILDRGGEEIISVDFASNYEGAIIIATIYLV